MVSKLGKISLIVIVSFALFVLESIIKYTLVNKIPSQGFYLFKSIVQIIYTPNYNIAFSLPLPLALIVFLVVSALIFLSFVWWLNLTAGNLKLLLATSLVMVGALSNLLDRAILGYVVDYVNIFVWPIFNLADCLIVAGILVYLFGEIRLTKRT
jgi:signal peptidase II